MTGGIVSQLSSSTEPPGISSSLPVSMAPFKGGAGQRRERERGGRERPAGIVSEALFVCPVVTASLAHTHTHPVTSHKHTPSKKHTHPRTAQTHIPSNKTHTNPVTQTHVHTHTPSHNTPHTHTHMQTHLHARTHTHRPDPDSAVGHCCVTPGRFG